MFPPRSGALHPQKRVTGINIAPQPGGRGPKDDIWPPKVHIALLSLRASSIKPKHFHQLLTRDQALLSQKGINFVG